MNKNIELLAPAGSMESLHAAVLAGADAVYMGGSKFSARAYASNFDEVQFKEALDYCHLMGKKVYVTINTLIKESEIIEAVNYAKFLYELGVDAFIIQDIGLTEMMRAVLKDAEIHASTQITAHNAEGAEFLTKLGFKRIVLSRELSISEIEEISIKHNIETEVFIHGALCICYSGQCLMSSLIGGRSGNRGRCAQPCRLPYTMIDIKNNREKQGYLLSPKDICNLDNIEDVVNAGVASLKIEGRMKRSEYVAGVVSSYKKALDKINSKTTAFNIKEEYNKILKLFNREGFSKAYMYGNAGRDMMAYNNPKNAGISIGKAEQGNIVLLEDNIAVGDGISFSESGFTVSKILKGKQEVKEASKGDRVVLYPLKYKAGNTLYKTSDSALLSELGTIYKNPLSKKNKIDLKVKFKIGEPIVLSSEYNGEKYSFEGAVVQEATNKPLTQSRIEENLRKTGDSFFEIDRIVFESFSDGFAPLSLINAVRRELIDSITVNEKNKYRRKAPENINIEEVYKELYFDIKKETIDIPEYIVCVSTEEQLRAAVQAGCENVAIDLYKRNGIKDINNIKVKNIYLKVPNIIKKEYDTVCSFIEGNIQNIKGIITGNLGVIDRFGNSTLIIGDYKLNVFNSVSARTFNKYIDLVPLSVELNKKEILQITKACSTPFQLMVYGKAEVMVSEYCPIGSIFGGKCANKLCSKPCEGSQYLLKDRKEESFTLKSDEFCRSYVYNSLPTNLIPIQNEINKTGIKSLRLDFIDEDYSETMMVLNSFLNNTVMSEDRKYTKGHFKRGVE